MNEPASTRRVIEDHLLLYVRALMPDDAPLLVELFEHLGADSRYLRFNVALTNPDPDLVRAEAARMAAVSLIILQ